MQILGHSKNTALECFIQFLKKSEEIKELNKVERLELWSDRSTQWNSEKNIVQASTFIYWWASRDLNPGPGDYESDSYDLFRLLFVTFI